MIRHDNGLIEYEVGDRVRLRTPTTDRERRNLPFGSNDSKISFMDEKTVYTISKIQRARRYGANQRIYLEECRGDREGHPGENRRWSYSEKWCIPVNMDVTQKVYDVLQGNMIPIKSEEVWHT